jgi:acyl carrier protein
MKTNASDVQIREVIRRALSDVAPEVDPANIDPIKDLREQADIDSVGFMTFIIGLHRELDIEIPDADVSKLTTLEGCSRYLMDRLNRG